MSPGVNKSIKLNSICKEWSLFEEWGLFKYVEEDKG